MAKTKLRTIKCQECGFRDTMFVPRATKVDLPKCPSCDNDALEEE